MHPLFRRLIACALFLAAPVALAGTDTHPTSTEAYNHCMISAAANAAALMPTVCSASYTNKRVHNVACVIVTGNKWQENADIAGTNVNGENPNCSRLQNSQTNLHTYTTNNCASQPDHHDWTHPEGQSTTCSEGCTFIVSGPPLGWSPDGSVCNVGPTSPNPVTDPDTDGDGVTDTHDEFPNDPGETTDSDGDGIGDNGDSAPGDPTNGGDTPGDEDGDDEGDNQASGGGKCGSPPPACVGDGIACMVVFQSFMGRCATEAQDGVLDRIADGIEGLGDGPVGGGSDMGIVEGLLTDLKGIAQDIQEMMHGEGDDEVPDLSNFTVPEEEVVSELPDWDSGAGGAAACPAPFVSTISLGDTSTELELSLDPLCEFSEAIYWIIMAIAAVVSAHIFLSGMRS